MSEREPFDYCCRLKVNNWKERKIDMSISSEVYVVSKVTNASCILLVYISGRLTLDGVEL